MAKSKIYDHLEQIAQTEFAEILVNTKKDISPKGESTKLRLTFIDGSFMDVFFSRKGQYNYHWQRDKEIYRWDNADHWPDISTHPKHCHSGSDKNVMESAISDIPEEALRSILSFLRDNKITPHHAAKE